MTAAVRTSGLTKHYGDVRALIDLDLEVATGEVYGYLGPNGSGKTTTIRCLLDILRPTSGQVRVLGLDPQAASVEVRRRTGYLPGDLLVKERFTARALFDAWGALRGGVDRSQVDRLCERLELDPTRRVHDLSKGNRQKVGVVQAFAHEPELLVLDEPTSGLDPLVQNTVLELVSEARDAGATVLMSSHVLSEVERVADRVGIIRAGRLVAQEDVHVLKARALREMRVRFAGGIPPASFEGLPSVRSAQVVGDELVVTVQGSVDTLLKALAQHEVESLISDEADLERVFLGYYTEELP
ncbi:MAG TPA: ABC transporter ATP-binding protein [Nitriliruptorales bacterium]